MAWTTPKTWAYKDAPSSVDFNKYIRDNLQYLYDNLLPIGTVLPYSGGSAPAGRPFLLADGSAVSRTTYADLFSLVGTTYGVGDNSTTFNVPDMRGRVPLGKDNMGGSAANRVTATTADNLGQGAGNEAMAHTHTTDDHTHTTADHTHTVNNHTHTLGGHVHRHVHNHGFGGNMGGAKRDGNSSDFAHNATGYSAPSHYHEGATATNAGGVENTEGPNTDSGGSTPGTSGASTGNTTSGASAGNTTSAASNTDNMQPYITLNYLIKY